MSEHLPPPGSGHLIDRRTLLGATAATAAGAALPLVGADPADAAPRVGRTLASGLSIPWGVTFLPGGDALVGERSGGVHLVRRTGGRSRVADLDVVAEGEGGLLGLATHPQFADNRWVYAYETSGSDNRVVRYEYSGGRLHSRQVLLPGIPKGTIHNGGRLAFSPGGLLYVATGDVGRGELAQNRSSLGGKILRMRADGSVPPKNPFGNHVWSFGHRNVQGLAWDGSGRLWATELGQQTRDELNVIVRAGNYGWPRVEGGDGSGPFRDPFVTWRPTSSCSPSGVAVARGHAWVGALAGQALFSVKLAGRRRRRKVRHFHQRFGRIRTVQKAPDGSLWITTSNGGGNDRVVRILP